MNEHVCWAILAVAFTPVLFLLIHSMLRDIQKLREQRRLTSLHRLNRRTPRLFR